MTFFQRDVPLTQPHGWDVRATDSGEIVSDTSALALSAVWACVNLVSGTIASLPLQLFRTMPDGTRKAATDHPLYRVLHDSPNADQTALEFWEHQCASLELSGNCYAVIERGVSGNVIGLSPLAPSVVTNRRLPSGAIEYRWTNNGRSYVSDETGIFHVRGFGGDALRGRSTLAMAAKTLGLAQAINLAASTTFKNGLRPSGQLTVPTPLPKDQRDAIMAKLAQDYQGAVNAGKPLVLEGGLEWKPLSINPEDAQMLESRGFSIEEICRFFGVPPFMIGHTEKTTSWGTGLEQQILAFQKFTLRRRIERIEQRIAKSLFSAQDRAEGLQVEFNFEGLLRGDTASRFASYQTGLQNGIYAINEVRRFENLPPVEGGDVPRMQAQNMPITAALNAVPVKPTSA